MAQTIQNNNYGIGRVGGAGVGSRQGQGIYAESSTAVYDLGEKLELSDGRIFRYTKAGAAINAGNLVAQDFSAGNIAEFDNATISPVAAGSSVITITASALSGVDEANELAGSFINTVNDDGEGYAYKIKSHGVESSNAVEFTLFDPLVVAVASSGTDMQITAPPYRQVVTCAATVGAATDTMPVGVTPRAFTSGYYGWIQTRGICTCLFDGGTTDTPHVGVALRAADQDAGAVEPRIASSPVALPTVGIVAVGAAADTQHVSMNLMLE